MTVKNMAVAPGTHPDDFSARFHAKLGVLGQLHDKKRADYGSDEDPAANMRASLQLGIKPSIGVLLRMNDKMTRLKQFAKKGTLRNESAEDSLQDIAVYAILALCLMEEGD